MHDAWNDRLSEYLDGELTAAERGTLDAHLAACDGCRRDLEELRALTARARALPDSPPDADLWPGVAARIGAGRSAPGPRQARQFSFTLPQLVAAGLALMVLSGATVWVARLGGNRTDFPPVVATDVVPANFADGAYEDAIADLQRTLEAGRSRLDEQTVQVLETNLAAIDRAIAQCRDALRHDPANVYLHTYLAESRARKLELLRHATAIVDKRS